MNKKKRKVVASKSKPKPSRADRFTWQPKDFTIKFLKKGSKKS